MSAAELRNISCLHGEGAAVNALSAVFDGGMHLLRGEAGGGKETLLRLLGLLVRPDSGELLLLGQPTGTLDDDARADLRNRRCGYVFAAPFLLAGFSVAENVAMPLFKISQVGPDEARVRTEEVLEFCGLTGEAQAVVDTLPLIAQFRVALARALVNEPALVLVENLDADLTGDDLRQFTALLRQAAAHRHLTVIATVSPAFSHEPADRVLEIAAGAIARDSSLLPRL